MNSNPLIMLLAIASDFFIEAIAKMKIFLKVLYLSLVYYMKTSYYKQKD